MSLTLNRSRIAAVGVLLALVATIAMMGAASAPAAATSSLSAEFVDRCDGTVEVTVIVGDLYGYPSYRTVSVTGAEEHLVVNESSAQQITVPGDEGPISVETVYTDELEAEHEWTPPTDGSCDQEPSVEVTDPTCDEPATVTVTNPGDNALAISVTVTGFDPVALEPGHLATFDLEGEATVSGVYGKGETVYSHEITPAQLEDCPVPESPTPDSDTVLTSSTDGDLPATGIPTGLIVAAGAALLAAGAALAYALRRRRYTFTTS